MTKETKLNLFKGLPDTDKWIKIYVESPETMLQECLAFQDYPYEQWVNWKTPEYYEHQWLPIPWIGGKRLNIPFGYEKNEEKAKKYKVDPDSILFPVPEELFALEEGKVLVNKYTAESISEYITDRTGRYISPNTFRKRLSLDRQRRSKTKLYRNWAIRISKALIAAAKIEQEYSSAKVPWARQKNFYGVSNFSNGRGKKIAQSARDLFKICDPRPYIRNILDREQKEHGKQEGDEEALEQTLSSIGELFEPGPARGDVPPADSPRSGSADDCVQAERRATD